MSIPVDKKRMKDDFVSREMRLVLIKKSCA